MSEQAARKQEALKEAVRPHQPDQETFRSMLAEDIEWKPFPAFPPEARLAVLFCIGARRGAAETPRTDASSVDMNESRAGVITLCPAKNQKSVRN